MKINFNNKANALHLQIFIALLLFSFSGISNAHFCTIRPALKDNSFSFGPGFGRPNNLKGARLDYRRTWYQGNIFAIFGELSVARWYADHSIGKHMTTYAAAPVFRAYPFQTHLFIDASVGLSKLSSNQLGRRHYPAKWLFQDILGVGYSFFQENIDVRIQYIHYSNAGIKKPNPGIDIVAAIQVAYYF